MRGHPEIEDVVGSVTSFCTCQVLRPRRAVRALALTCPYVLPSAFGVGAQGMNLYEAQWLAYALPYRRFAAALTDCNARLGADVNRYSLIVSDLHRLLVAGLPAHCERFWTLPLAVSFVGAVLTAIYLWSVR